MSIQRSTIDYRPRLVPWVLFTVLSMGACGDDGVSPQVIEETDFAASLGVDLSAMTLTSSGLYLQDLTVGSGDTAVSGDVVIVTFTGWLANGSTFDAGSFSFPLGCRTGHRGLQPGGHGHARGGNPTDRDPAGARVREQRDWLDSGRLDPDLPDRPGRDHLTRESFVMRHQWPYIFGRVTPTCFMYLPFRSA